MGSIMGKVDNMWRMYAHERLQSMVGSVQNKLLFILDHPYISAVGLLMLKGLRAAVCYAMSGLETEVWEEMKKNTFSLMEETCHIASSRPLWARTALCTHSLRGFWTSYGELRLV